MKKYCYFNGLLVIHPLISARHSSSTTSVKNSNYSSPPLKQTKYTKIPTPEPQTAPDKTYKRNIVTLLGLFWIWLLARLYTTENNRRIFTMQLEDLALLKIIKDNALWLSNNYHPEKLSCWRS